jgi:hypothetical protein
MNDSYKLSLMTLLTWCSLQVTIAVAADQALETLPDSKNISLPSESFKGRRINAHELSVGDIQNIQGIGRSVLAAKHSQPVDLNAQLLKQNIETLHQKLVELERSDALPVATSESTSPLVIGSMQTTDGKPQTINQQSINAEARAAQVQTKEQKMRPREESEQQVKQQIDQIHQQLAGIKRGRQSGLSAKSLDLNATNTNGESRSNVYHLDADMLGDKAEQLATEVNQALARSGEDRAQILATLRERLTTKNLSELQGKAEPAPTISTITHHRP